MAKIKVEMKFSEEYIASISQQMQITGAASYEDFFKLVLNTNASLIDLARHDCEFIAVLPDGTQYVIMKRLSEPDEKKNPDDSP